MGTRTANESKFGNWTELSGGGRQYWLDVVGKMGWRARYHEEVDAQEATLRFWQEIFDDKGIHVETHQKFPVDTGDKKVTK